MTTEIEKQIILVNTKIQKANLMPSLVMLTTLFLIKVSLDGTSKT